MNQGPGRHVPVLVALLALALHAPGIGGSYVLDDTEALLKHPVVTGQAPLWEVFVREYWGRRLDAVEWSSSYRPLTSLTFAVEHRITAEPWLHHAVNVVLFAGLCAAVAALARRWTGARGAAVAGALFAALPVHVESVASIVGRADVLAALLALLAVHLALTPRAGPRRLVLAALAYLAALLCKEVVALLPLIVAWLGWLGSRDRPVRALVPAAALGVVGLAYLVARHAVLPVGLPPSFVDADNQLRGLGGLAALTGRLSVLGQYAELVVLPLRLCADHTYADVVLPDWPRAALGALVVSAALIDGVRAARGTSRGLLFTAALAYLLVGHFVIRLSVLVAERLMLWPSVWLAVWAGALAGARWPGRVPRTALALGVAVVALLGVRATTRTLEWRDGASLYESSARRCPAAVHGRLNLAREMRKLGRTDDAVWHYGVAAGGRSAWPEPWDPPAFDVEWTVPVTERLPRLPELLGVPAEVVWPNLHRFLLTEGATAEAARVAGLARAR